MSEAAFDLPPAPPRANTLRMLLRDPGATVAVCWLILLAVGIVLGQTLLADAALKSSLIARNRPPFSLGHGWIEFLGTDSLGRSLLARLCVAASTSLTIAFATVGASMVLGTFLGVMAGYRGGILGTVILRVTDMVLSFPTLLLALVVLFLFGPSALNVILVLAITRAPAYIRVARAEVLEIRERLFVDAARVFGAGTFFIVRVHILPIVLPTMLTLASLNLALVMLIESGLSFLGLGIQPPDISWGLMIAQGRGYLSQAWWLAALPGLAIMFTTMSFNLLSNWVRAVTDPQQRWRLDGRGGAK